MQDPSSEFLAVAEVLGHTEGSQGGALWQGDTVCTYFGAATPEDLSRLACRATEAQRHQRLSTFFNPSIALRSRLGQGIHDRGEAAVFAAFQLSPEDRANVQKQLPAPVKAVSVISKRVAAGEEWDVSVRGEAWGLDDSHDLYVIVNAGTVILERGASIAVRGNVLSLLCQRLIVEDEGSPYHIGILPTPFSVDLRGGPLHGPPGARGANGHEGSSGRTMHVIPNILGGSLAHDISQEELHGHDGVRGADGSTGKDGRNGGMAKFAEITLRDVEGVVTLFVQAGTGGDGGRGGDGGDGGRGGDGARAYKVIREVFRGGNGGKGGDGGNGGEGGRAGSGGIASNVYINVQPGQEDRIRVTALASAPGNPGSGGNGGKAGDGGCVGAGPRSELNGTPGGRGVDGSPGRGGRHGRSRPAPYVFLNETRYCEERMLQCQQD
ncbi:MAG: hypothetical protein JNL98_07145 [Bryobacterales bacterium]|nr:hypothetical protein [Bryobacterales bacterium]